MNVITGNKISTVEISRPPYPIAKLAFGWFPSNLYFVVTLRNTVNVV